MQLTEAEYVHPGYALKGRYAVCVGCTSGIGKGIALRLAEMSVHVTLFGRNTTMGEDTIKQMLEKFPNGHHHFVHNDATSMKSIAESVQSYLVTRPDKPLHFLVQSQGMATMAGRTETSEGIDQKLALHYYGRVLFNRMFAPRMKETALHHEYTDVRSLSVLSGGVHSSYNNLDDMDLKHSFSLPNAANAAGFYNDLAADQMSRDIDYLKTGSSNDGKRGISYIHAAPGMVKTTWGKDFPWYALYPVRLLQHFLAKSPEECAKLMIDNALVAPLRQGQGFHVMSETGGVAKVTDLHNDRYREAVWKHTNELIDNALAR